LSAHETTSSGDLVAPEGRRQDVLAILALTATVLLTLALVSYDARNGTANLVGPVGHRFARAVMLAFGLIAWILPLEGGLLTWRLFRRRSALLGLATLGSTLVLVVIGAALGHLLIEPRAVWGASPGGAVGELLGEVLRSLLGFYGTVIIGFAILGTAIILRTPWTLEETARAFARIGHAAWAKIRGIFIALREAWAEAREIHDEEVRASQPRIMGTHYDREKSESSPRRSRAQKPSRQARRTARQSSHPKKPNKSLWRSRRVRSEATVTSSCPRPSSSTSQMRRKSTSMPMRSVKTPSC
jgi:S-DNA-T family DNA segregation ATPase FtsK/SpoIIIE